MVISFTNLFNLHFDIFVFVLFLSISIFNNLNGYEHCYSACQPKLTCLKPHDIQNNIGTHFHENSLCTRCVVSGCAG